MITVVKTCARGQKPWEVLEVAPLPEEHLTLYIRRDWFPDLTFEEYAYRGPDSEVMALGVRAHGMSRDDYNKLDTLLCGGMSFDEALTELGR